MTINYTVPDSLNIEAAIASADHHRGDSDPGIKNLVFHMDRLVAELRERTQAHAEAIEAYGALRRRVQAAIEADDYS